MRLIVNGQPVETPAACQTVADLLALPQWQNRMVIAELNGTILSGDQHKEAKLSEGDRIELVHFVGGG